MSKVKGTVHNGKTGIRPESLLCIAEGLDVVLISGDEVLIQFGSRSYPSELLRDTDLRGILGQLFSQLLQGPADLAGLLADLRADDQVEARSLIASLLERGILTELERSPIEQYLRYTFAGDSALATCSVSLIGAGPLGARLAHSLLQHGVGRIALLDDRPADKLWHTFLPREPNGRHAGNGAAHVMLRERLLDAGRGDVELVDGGLDAAGVAMAVAASDFTVLALEQPDLLLSHIVNRFCIRDLKPWLLAVIDGNFGLVGPLFLPLHTACYNDYRTLAYAANPSPAMARRHQEYVRQRGASTFFLGLPAYAEIVAGFASLASVHFLLRESSFALGRVLTIDFDRMLIDVEDVLKLPRCPVCGDQKAAYQPPFSAEIVTRAATMGAVDATEQ